MPMHENRPYNRFARYLLGTAFTIIFFFSCQNADVDDRQKFDVKVKEPVGYTWKDIQRHGVLRVITKYNSSSYFLHRGMEQGFEYELLRDFAREQNLALEVVIQPADVNPIDMLNAGEGDVIAGNFAVNPERELFVNFTRPYNLANEIIVVSELSNPVPKTLTELEGLTISVRGNSSYYQTLKRIIDQGINITIDIVSEDSDTESLIAAVSRGQIQATVADHNLLNAAKTYIEGVTAGPVISENNRIAWAIRKNNPELLTRMNRYLFKHFRFTEDEKKPYRSTFLAILNRRYYEDFDQISSFRTPNNETRWAGILSPYDELIKPIAEEYGVDWKLIVAMMAQESRFDASAKSWAGAVGLMQVVPRFSPYTEVELFDPEISVREGVRIVTEHIAHYAYLDSVNQIAYSLATYNAGLGHVADARRLVIDQNKNPNEWENVSDALLKLMNRKYYKDARYGFCRGIETVRYVKEIQNRYSMYQTILQFAEADMNSRSRGTVGFMQASY